jgi:hypothetical protein
MASQTQVCPAFRSQKPNLAEDEPDAKAFALSRGASKSNCLSKGRGISNVTIWMRLILAALATWRLTHLAAREDGPGRVLFKVRRRLGRSFWGKLMDCFQCLSLWFAAPLAWWISQEPVDWLVAWLALSGAACLLERVGSDPVVIEPLRPESTEEPTNGMLWSKSNGVEPAPIHRPRDAAGH